MKRLLACLFLIGLSLTVTGRGRYLLAVPGVAVAMVCVGWSILITTGTVTKVSDHAVDLTADGSEMWEQVLFPERINLRHRLSFAANH